MPGLILAAVTSDNVRGGYFWTFLFPMLLFIVAGTALYVFLFSRPHARVPPRRIQLAQGGVPEAGPARGAAVAGGLSVAPGGGTAESPAEPHGAPLGAQEAAGKVAEPDGGSPVAPDDDGTGSTEGE